MRIKTFEAATMQEALSLARAELGEEAVVLNTRHVRAGGVLGLGGVTRVELTAAVDECAPAAPSQPSRRHSQEVGGGAESIAAVPAPYAVKAYSSAAAVAERDTELNQIRSDIRNLEAVVQRLLASASGRGQEGGNEGAPLLARLGVDEDLARGALGDLIAIEQPTELASALAAKMQSYAAPPVPDGHDIIAVVGPTGVGKTTTLAKLAARFALEQGRNVALVTADTYRIGAMEQLRTYARIMGLPLEIALSPDEVTAGVAKHRDKDVVLIDTVGRSQRSNEHLAELRAFVEAANPTDVYLCVAASLAGDVQREVVERFAALSPTRLVVTKLDESSNRGALVNLPLRTGLGISCMTAGQNVPQDIEFADAGVIARMVAGVAQ